MFSSLLLCVGLILLILTFKVFLKEKALYDKGIKKRAKVLEINSYSYITSGADYNKVYHVGENPVLELEVEDKKVKVQYRSYEEICELKEGDELDVIYPKGNLGGLVRYSKYGIFKKSINLSLWSMGLIVLSLLITIF